MKDVVYKFWTVKNSKLWLKLSCLNMFHMDFMENGWEWKKNNFYKLQKFDIESKFK